MNTKPDADNSSPGDPSRSSSTCGSSSMVECHLAKVEVAGSSPVYRSIGEKSTQGIIVLWEVMNPLDCHCSKLLMHRKSNCQNGDAKGVDNIDHTVEFQAETASVV